MNTLIQTSHTPLRPSSWLVGKITPQARLRLVCFPYAGGGAGVFATWRKPLPEWVDLLAVTLPGRGARMMEAPVRNMDALIPYLAEATSNLGPCVFFGHSMGAFMAYETAKLLQQSGQTTPLKLIVSGQRAPHLPAPDRPVHALPRHEFIAELRRQGGTPEEVLCDTELMSLLTPMLRADFEMCERYAHRKGLPLNIPITAFGGEDDPKAGCVEVAAWVEHTSLSFSQCEFEGGHFFIHETEKQVTWAITKELEPLCENHHYVRYGTAG